MTVALKPGEIGAALVSAERRRQQRIAAAVYEAALLGAEIVAERVPIRFGTLKASIHAEQTAKGADLLVDAPHAAVVERGSRPHWAPIQPLIDWARGDKSLAYAVRAKIAAEGTQPTWYMRGALPKLRKVLTALIKQALKGDG